MVRKIGLWLYFIWISFWFLLGFFLLFPFFWLIIQRKSWHRFYYPLSKAWAQMFYFMVAIPVKRHWHFSPSKKQKYIYCPNHFSYMDIPLLTLTMPSFFVFVGLHDLEKIPLFGYMYRNIHITVDRSSMKDRYATYRKSKEALEAGKNLLIFPEGGIWTKDFPALSPFKDGPFRIAIEQQIPLVPVTIPYNWKLLPVFDVKRLQWHRQEIIFHPPIETQGMDLKDLSQLKAQTYAIIDNQLKTYFPDTKVPD